MILLYISYFIRNTRGSYSLYIHSPEVPAVAIPGIIIMMAPKQSDNEVWPLGSGEDKFMCLFVITVMSNIGLAPMSSSPVCQFSVHVCHRLMYCSESSDHDNILKFQY